MKRTVTWIVVADGARARVLTNDGPGRGLRPALDREFVGSRLPTRGLVSDRPGRTFDRAGPARHAKEPPTDPHRHAEQSFLRDLADMVRSAALRHTFDRLVLVAPPRALGDLRAALADDVRGMVVAEVNKDLTTARLNDVADQVGRVLAV